MRLGSRPGSLAEQRPGGIGSEAEGGTARIGRSKVPEAALQAEPGVHW